MATRLSGKHSTPVQPAKEAPVREVPGDRAERTLRSSDTVYANKGAQFLMASDAKVKHKLERRMSRNRTSPRVTAEDEVKCVWLGLDAPFVASSWAMTRPGWCMELKCTASS